MAQTGLPSYWQKPIIHIVYLGKRQEDTIRVMKKSRLEVRETHNTADTPPCARERT